MTEGVCFISWIPAYAGMTKDYWIAWSPGIRPAKSQEVTEVIRTLPQSLPSRERRKIWYKLVR